MRRITLFLILTILSLVSLVAVVGVGYYVLVSPSSQYQSSWGNMWDNMWGGMGGMMGEGTQPPVQNTAAPYFAVAFVALVGVAIVGVGGLVYFIALPEIKNTQPALKNGAPQQAEVAVTPYASVLKTLTNDERKVVEVLSAHEGKYLQKYIRKEAGLSRLQTHRIVARLAERGIVSLEKTGNTNTVLLAGWLK
jgi:hypothetical protein